MIKKLTICLIVISLASYSKAQESTKIPLPKNLEQGYPRLYITQAEKRTLEKTIQQEEWAQDVLSGIHSRVDEHVKRHINDPEWMVSLNGSLGNHMHANGINMELYGKGFVQGADPGKGAGYLQPIYLEYYSQFPAHNTVMVDGVSSYTEMLSYHAFDLMGEYPKSEQKEVYYPNITYSDVYFLEPETLSDQNRLVSIVKTGETTGCGVEGIRIYYLPRPRRRPRSRSPPPCNSR